ncbi:hypothetical protein PCASD_19454 [Puccinia coronata f. sp. avenae]|uniref:Uncharacterized protein n=1 Tax=Puccinia coronata f. sp. avenae TaxID=200324 RepID=A0A2N5TU13_9BASI|nr:hypothetical protein PCASD_19454 [Puccinia coronata f. sp. avenae]
MGSGCSAGCGASPAYVFVRIVLEALGGCAAPPAYVRLRFGRGYLAALELPVSCQMSKNLLPPPSNHLTHALDRLLTIKSGDSHTTMSTGLPLVHWLGRSITPAFQRLALGPIWLTLVDPLGSYGYRCSRQQHTPCLDPAFSVQSSPMFSAGYKYRPYRWISVFPSPAIYRTSSCPASEPRAPTTDPIDTDSDPADTQSEPLLTNDQGDPVSTTYPFTNFSRPATPNPPGFFNPEDYHWLDDDQIHALLRCDHEPALFDRFAFGPQHLTDLYQSAMSAMVSNYTRFPPRNGAECANRVQTFKFITRRYHSLDRVMRRQ